MSDAGSVNATTGPEGGRTRRQQLVELLGQGTFGFSELRERLGVTVAQLDDDLRHVERSVRGRGARLRVEPARCGDCGFVFRRREPRRFHPPGRCPSCRGEFIVEARLSLSAPGRSGSAS